MGNFFRKNFLKIKIALSLPSIIYLLVFIFNRYNLPINPKAVPNEWVDLIHKLGFDSFINILTNSICISSFNIVEKIIIFLLLIVFILIVVLGYLKLYKFIGAILFLILKYIYVGYTNYSQKLDVILEITWLKLIFYRQGSIDDIYKIIDYVIERFNRPGLEKHINKKDLLDYVLNSNFKTTQEIIDNLVLYVTDHYLELLTKSELNYDFLLASGAFITYTAITVLGAFANYGLDLNDTEGTALVCSYYALTNVTFSFVYNHLISANVEEAIINAKALEIREKENSSIIEEIIQI